MNELGNLSHCMVDSDFGGFATTRIAKRKALIVSGALEFVLIALAILGPLARPEILSPRTIVTPLPPFRGVPQTQAIPQHPDDAPPTPSERLKFSIPIIASHAAQMNASETTDADPFSSNSPPIPGGGNLGEVFLGESASGPVIVAPPHPASNLSHPLQVSSGVMLAALVYRVEPVYPMIAKQMHVEGTVSLRAIIRTDGSVGDLSLVDGNPILAFAAKAAIRQWRYKPTLLSGQPVEVETIITVNFRLD